MSEGEAAVEFAELEMAESTVIVRCTADLTAGRAEVEAIVVWIGSMVAIERVV